jgi:hypothetical protein
MISSKNPLMSMLSEKIGIVGEVLEASEVDLQVFLSRTSRNTNYLCHRSIQTEFYRYSLIPSVLSHFFSPLLLVFGSIQLQLYNDLFCHSSDGEAHLSLYYNQSLHFGGNEWLLRSHDFICPVFIRSQGSFKISQLRFGKDVCEI